MLRFSTQLYFMIVYFARMFCFTHSGICSLIVRKPLCVPPMRQYTQGPGCAETTHGHQTSRAARHRRVRKVHARVLYVVNVTCTVVQRLHSEFILLLIKRHHVLFVHRNSSTLPAETSTSA